MRGLSAVTRRLDRAHHALNCCGDLGRVHELGVHHKTRDPGGKKLRDLRRCIKGTCREDPRATVDVGANGQLATVDVAQGEPAAAQLAAAAVVDAAAERLEDAVLARHHALAAQDREANRHRGRLGERADLVEAF